MNVVINLYILLLFVALTPGVLLTLPKGGSKLVVAAVHGLVFAIVYYLTYKAVWRFSVSMDGFADPEMSKVAAEAQDRARAHTAARARAAAAIAEAATQ